MDFGDANITFKLTPDDAQRPSEGMRDWFVSSRPLSYCNEQLCKRGATGVSVVIFYAQFVPLWFRDSWFKKKSLFTQYRHCSSLL